MTITNEAAFTEITGVKAKPRAVKPKAPAKPKAAKPRAVKPKAPAKPKAAKVTKPKAAKVTKPKAAKVTEVLLVGAEHLVGVNFAKSRQPMTAAEAVVIIDKCALLAGKLEHDLTPFMRIKISSAVLGIMDRLRIERLAHLDHLSEEEVVAVKASMFEIVSEVRDKMQLAYA